MLPPIPTKDLTPADVDDLTQRVRKQMQEELVSLTELARGQGIAMSESQAKEVDGSAVTATGVEYGRRGVAPAM